MSCPEVLLEGFPKNATQRVMGTIQEYRGKCLAHLRVYAPSAEVEEEWVPQKGIAFPTELVAKVREGVESLTDVAGTNKVVCTIPLDKDAILIGTKRFKGNQYVYVRRHYKSGDEWKPTGKGVDVRSELLDELISLVKELEAEATGH